MPITKYGLSELDDAVSELGGQRLLLITGKSARFADRVRKALAGRELETFAGAVRHVPDSSVEAAGERLRAFRADTILTLGGGAATGLGKALRLKNDVRFIAIPTTYSGSEETNLHGTTSTKDGVARKTTGRDDRVRPDVVIHAVELMLDMPKRLTVTSLMNAAAHTVGVLAHPDAPDDHVARAVSALATVFGAIESLVRAPRDPHARKEALTGAAEAARVLAEGSVGIHHQLAHALGGRFDLDHAALHSALLPHSVHALRESQRGRLREVERRLGIFDLERELFDLLQRSGAPTSLVALGVPEDALDAEPLRSLAAPDSVFRLALSGRRPSSTLRKEPFDTPGEVFAWGALLDEASVVVIALHGEGEAAEDAIRDACTMLGLAPDCCVVAPQTEAESAEGGRGARDRAPPRERTLALLEAVARRAPSARLALLGVAGGARLALECVAMTSEALDAVVALADRVEKEWTPRSLGPPRRPCSVLLGSTTDDDGLASLTAALETAGFTVERSTSSGGDCRAAVFRLRARVALLGGEFQTAPGFGGFFETEALPGALPRTQNSPRHAPYGLYAEQLSGTPFTLKRHSNLRSWLYRIRPAAQQSEFSRFEHPTFTTGFAENAAEPNLCGWGPVAFPEAPTDFLQGIVTIGGAGDPVTHTGYAVHWYGLNRSMDERAFCNADGDLLLVPQFGALTLLTESGVLDLCLGQIAILPRGLRFSVLLRSPFARGFMGEVYGRHFELPERGPIGANGLADARHFRAPNAWFEDRLRVGYSIVNKLGGRLYETRQDHSPFDVVAWHGNYAPFVYDLSLFSPVGNVRIDHADPSIYTVLSCPLTEPGHNLLDLVIFAPRWDPSEHTFRPPYFHRNAAMEFNGVLRNQALEGVRFEAGSCFLTPPMTPHGVTSSGVERALSRHESRADRPHRHSDDSLWFQFESCLPMQLSTVALDSPFRILDWPLRWGTYRTHFRPYASPPDPETNLGREA